MSIHFEIPGRRFDTIPVLLLGGVNLVRALGAAGIPAVVASTDPDDPVFASRYCAARCILPSLEKPEAAIDAIVGIGDRLSTIHGRRVPLIYGSDEYLKVIYAYKERLERYFLILVSEKEIGEALLDKDRFQALAASRGIPVARILDWDGDGAGTLAGTPGPVIVKPRTKHDWHDSPMRLRIFGDAKARIYASGPDARNDPGVAHFREQLSFQEYVPGDDTSLWSFHGVADENGIVMDGFVGRKIRTYPPLTGESAFIELEEDETLTALGREVAAKLPLRGVFKMDFKKDPATGRYFLLEINARFNLWMYLGARNGLNLVRTTYDYLLEGARPTTAGIYTRRYRWLSLSLDFASFREMRRNGDLNLPAWLASILLSRNVYSYFAWTDPGPWARIWTNRLRRVYQRGPTKILALMRQWLSTAS
jgi:D-aspartate ligase